MKKNDGRIINKGKKEPPVALVTSWVYLLNAKAESPEIRRHAADRLMLAFGSVEAVEAFCKENNIN